MEDFLKVITYYTPISQYFIRCSNNFNQMSNVCYNLDSADDAESNFQRCENCNSDCGVISRNGMCSVCYDTCLAMDNIAAIDASQEEFLDEVCFSQPDQTNNSQLVEVAADGSAFNAGESFSVAKFMESNYRCDIVDPVYEFFDQFIYIRKGSRKRK